MYSPNTAIIISPYEIVPNIFNELAKAITIFK